MRFDTMSSNALYGAVALFSAMAMALCGVGLMDSSEAAYDETSDIYELELAPGFSYTWTPTYPSDLDVTTTVEKYEEGVVAQMVGESVQITVADGTTFGTYDVLIKAYTDTAGIEQTIYKIIRVTVAAGLEVSGSINNIILGASVDFTPNASSGMTEVITWTSSDTSYRISIFPLIRKTKYDMLLRVYDIYTIVCKHNILYAPKEQGIRKFQTHCTNTINK